MKRVKQAILLLAITANIGVLAGIGISKASAEEPPTKTIDGIKGSIGGVFTCHCPDDAANCKCDVQ